MMINLLKDNKLVEKTEQLDKDYNIEYYKVLSTGNREELEYFQICIFNKEHMLISIKVLDAKTQDYKDYITRNGLDKCIRTDDYNIGYSYDGDEEIYKACCEDDLHFYILKCNIKDEKEFTDLIGSIF
ncbi:MAG: hypothetical protein K5795_06805, partial [Lachnospiraceae bacterium]|nr:hypothetical protein [Lachnospiraceae bacterium]